MERKIRLVLAYDGTDFCGWQHQPGQRTVQGVVEDALRRVLRHPVQLAGSGRTDSGVHAAAHVSHFTTTRPIHAQRLGDALTTRLPIDVAVVGVGAVHPAFHATQSAVSKQYRYRIHNSAHRPVEAQAQRSVYHCWRSLDVALMQEGAKRFIGEMDYSSMAAAGTVRQTMVREVLRCDVERHFDEIRIDVEGTGFLHKQVRNMCGTLIEVGRGRWEPKKVADILASRDRRQAGPTLPAKGLCLQWVRYPSHLLSPPPVVDEQESVVPTG